MGFEHIDGRQGVKPEIASFINTRLAAVARAKADQVVMV